MAKIRRIKYEESNNMISNERFISLCVQKVMLYENAREDQDEFLNIDDVFVVWSCKTLQNSKCLVSAKNKGAYYYEFTMNGDKGEIYMDVYKKVENIPLDTEGNRITTSIREKEITPRNCIVSTGCCG